MAKFNFIKTFADKVSKSGPFAVFFYIFCAMMLIACPFILFKDGYPVITAAEIVGTLLLIVFYLAKRTE